MEKGRIATNAGPVAGPVFAPTAAGSFRIAFRAASSWVLDPVRHPAAFRIAIGSGGTGYHPQFPLLPWTNTSNDSSI
jgi:hypothetical protein